MKSIIIISAIFLQALHLLSQSCFPLGITFTTQSQIDDFAIDYPGCTVVEGSLEVTGNDITNLHGLSQIESIVQALNVHSTSNLHSLAGLESLTSAGRVIVRSNTSLESLMGLQSLDSVNFFFAIQENPLLTNLQGLNSLRYVGNIISIDSNQNLLTLRGFDALTYAGGFFITDNPVLKNLEGLENVAVCDFHIQIQHNSSLETLRGMGPVRQVWGIEIRNNNALINLDGLDSIVHNWSSTEIILNPKLENIDGLRGLTRVDSDIEISNNALLSSIQGLENLREIDPSGVYIRINNNAQLTACAIKPFCENIFGPFTFVFYENAPGCNSEEEVQSACLVPSDDISNKKLKVYPNPAVLSLTIDGIPSQTKVNILDISGRQVFNGHYNQQIDVSSLEAGHFNIGIEGMNSIYRFVKL